MEFQRLILAINCKDPATECTVDAGVKVEAMPGTVLDPYTRVLASVADVVTKARRSFQTSSAGGRLLVGTVLWGVVWWAGAVVLVLSPIWMPLVVVSWLAFAGVQCCRALFSRLGVLRQRLLSFSSAHLLALSSPAGAGLHTTSSSIKVQQRAAAIQDRGFLRNIFDTLPGVDTEGALAKVDAWKERTVLEAGCASTGCLARLAHPAAELTS